MRYRFTTAQFLILTLFTFLISFNGFGQTSSDAWINEIHYDNTGGDTNEGVEIVIADISTYPLSEWSVVLYNGNNNSSYATIDFTTPDNQSTNNGFTIAWKLESGIQNGAPDGLALVHDDGTTITVVQFLSYEGSFTASNGPASGQTSTDIGVAETGSTLSSESLQLSGTGTQYSDFIWQSPAAHTRGLINTAQSFTSSCSLTDIGLANVSCNDNGTPNDSSDDVTSFELNPTGSNLGTSYTVEMTDAVAEISTTPTGPFSSFTASGTYGATTTFYLAPGSAGLGDLNISVTDDVDGACTLTGIITDPGSCSLGGGGTSCGVNINFETQGDGYLTSIPEFSDSSEDYFTQTDGSNIAGGVTFSNTDGNFFVAQDIDGEGASLPVELTIDNIDISTLTNLEFSIDLAEDDDGSNENWDASDYVHIFYTIDGGTEQNLLWIESELSSGSNGKPLIDTDFDGVGDGTEITDVFATFTESIAATGTTMDIRIEFNLNAGDEDIALDNISVCGIDSTIDADSQANAPSTTQIPSGTIIADASNSVASSVEVFKFDIEDFGSSDGLPTELTQLRLIPGTANTADWSQVIQGIRIESAGVGGVLAQGNQSLSISDTEIIVDILDNSGAEMTIPDGVTQEYTISVFLNTSGITDQEIIQFAIPSTSTNWEVASGSSQFASSFTNVEGNPFTIDVIGQTYAFISQPINANINAAMPTNVQIAYLDSNNNIDFAFTDSVQVTSTGTLQTSPLSAIPIGGIATFNGNTIIHTVAETDVNLIATSSATDFPATLVSDLFDIFITFELFISEVADPSDGGSEKYVELFNAGVTPIDFNSDDFFFTVEFNGGSSYRTVQLSGILPPKSYYIVSVQSPSDFSTTYNGVTSNTVISGLGNGNDAYFLSTSGSSSAEAINTQFDVYGEIGLDGTGEPWFYQDSRAYRINPDVKLSNTVWTNSEWTVDVDGATIADMTPGYGDQDYIYDAGNWNTNTYLSLDPDGISTTSQNIFIKSGTATLSSDIQVGDLVVRSGATLIIEGKLNISGDIVNEGQIIFESTSIQTAVLESVPSNSRIVGNSFEVRRYIPDSNRAFRYLSSSITTTNSSLPSINDNWQEGVNNTSTADVSNLNPNPGFGTHITGSITGANGLDATLTGNASLFEWEESLQNWEAITNTTTQEFIAGNAYTILIRGDRGTTLNSNTALGDPTVLRITGELQFGEFNVEASNLSPSDNPNGNFNLVGNPYQSQVDLKELLDNHSTGINNNIAYIFDPTIGTRGGYATIDLDNPSNPSVPSGTSANQYLQPNQAFFVESIGISPSITFVESVKNNINPQVTTFSETTQGLSTHINVNLRHNNQLIDGVRVMYDNSYSSEINTLDAVKVWNYNESVSVFSEGAYLSIEKRGQPSVSDTTAIQLFGYVETDYTLDLDFQLNNPINVDVYLFDNYTQNKVKLIPQELTSYEFSVDPSIPESTSFNRFELVYEEESLSLDEFNTTSIKVYPNPVVGEHVSISGTSEQIEAVNQVEVYTMQGQKLMSFNEERLDKTNGQINLSFSRQILKGHYLLYINTPEEVYVKKLIVN